MDRKLREMEEKKKKELEMEELRKCEEQKQEGLSRKMIMISERTKASKLEERLNFEQKALVEEERSQDQQEHLNYPTVQHIQQPRVMKLNKIGKGTHLRGDELLATVESELGQISSEKREAQKLQEEFKIIRPLQ